MSAEFNPALVLQQISMEALSADDRKQLIFRILNRTISLCPYHRAAIFELRKNKVKFLGVSGKSDVDKYSEVVEKWRTLVSSLPEHDKSRILNRDDFDEKSQQAWDDLAADTGKLGVFWVPISPWGTTRYGVWFERWENAEWTPRDGQLLELAGMAYKAAFERIEPATFFKKLKDGLITRRKILVLLCCLLIPFFSWRVPLRVVAPCEIVPQNPFVVTAPLAGVISEVTVESGDDIHKGDTLFSYDDRVVLEELNIAKQQVKILETTIRTASINAFSSPKAKAELEILNYRLKQEKIRLALAEYRASKLHVQAEVNGSVVVDDPDEWRGRPVEVGQKVLMLVDPAEMYLKIRLPEADNIDFGKTPDIKVVLNALPEESVHAELYHVAKSVTLSPEGIPSLQAEAHMENNSASMLSKLRIGLKGTAILYGENVSVAYWLLRKPWAAARKFLGY